MKDDHQRIAKMWPHRPNTNGMTKIKWKDIEFVTDKILLY